MAHVKIMRVVPVILTCDQNPEITSEFAASFNRHAPDILPPVVTVDTSASLRLNSEYLKTIVTLLRPKAVYIHPPEPDMEVYYSVQEAATWGLARALEEYPEEAAFLFMEDDIILSSRFSEIVGELKLSSQTGFVSLYLPGDGYGCEHIRPEDFYGTQCLLFPRKSVEILTDHWEQIKSLFPPGYDLRWARFLASKGLRPEAAPHSYVQHAGAVSRLHGSRSHKSEVFVP